MSSNNQSSIKPSAAAPKDTTLPDPSQSESLQESLIQQDAVQADAFITSASNSSSYQTAFAAKQYLRTIESLDDFTPIKGYDFDQPFSFQAFLESFATTGIQASELAKGIELANKMIDGKYCIFLSFTSNMISSGIREIITYLVKHKHVHCIVTSAGAIEEDVIKTLKPFVLGSFDTPGRVLFEKGVGRIGNIFAPFDRYLLFEQFMTPFLGSLYQQQQAQGRPCTGSELLFSLGHALGQLPNHESSFLYWAAYHRIPVFCPAITDGALGDLMHFQKQRTSDFYLDVVGDHHA
ncbi:MAG: deoxyhypusine synthase family protein, partial [Candidatus Woesearchaeota archaeon]